MRVHDVRLRLRTFGRRSVAAGLRLTPHSWLEPLRRPLAEGTLRERARIRVLELARHRGLPSGVSGFRLLDNPNVSFVNADSIIVQRLYWFGEKGYEAGLVEWWRYFCRRSQHILELGANVGYYTVQGARVAANGHYVAVEPHPEAARVCEANIALNGIMNVELVKAAAVADPNDSSLPLTIPRRDHFRVPTGSFLPGPTEIPGPRHNVELVTIAVPAVPIASLLTNVDLLKLDVEGQEHDLLLAGLDHILEHRPTVFLEILRDTPRLRFLVTEICQTARYSCYVPTSKGVTRLQPEAIQTVDFKAEYGTRDVILTTAEGLAAEAG